MLYTPQQVLAQLQQKQYAPVYFLQGEEPYYIDWITNFIEKNVLSASEKDFNWTVVYGKDQSMQAILTHARRFPINSERQVVLVKEAQDLQDLKREEGRNLLETYLRSPQPSTLLVFAHKHQPLDAKKSLYKMLAQQVVFMHAKRLYDNQLGAWISTYLQERGWHITEKATWMLQECIGNDLTRIAHELHKVCLNLGNSKVIDDVMIQTYVGISKAFNAFELQKALARKEIFKAHQIVQHFEINPRNNAAIPLVALLFSFFSKLLRLHHAQSKSSESLAKLLQVSPYFVQEYLMASQHYSLPKVIENIHHLHQADLRLKGVAYPTTPEGQILKELVFKLMH